MPAMLLRMRDQLPLSSESKYHMFCSLKGNESGVHYDLQMFPMLLLTVNWNPCDPWAFHLMVYKHFKKLNEMHYTGAFTDKNQCFHIHLSAFPHFCVI